MFGHWHSIHNQVLWDNFLLNYLARHIINNIPISETGYSFSEYMLRFCKYPTSIVVEPFSLFGIARTNKLNSRYIFDKQKNNLLILLLSTHYCFVASKFLHLLQCELGVSLNLDHIKLGWISV